MPYPNFGQVEYLDPVGYGNYNGLQASLTRDMRNGLSLRAAYTYSHSLDNSPEELETNSGDAPNGRNYGAWYGNSDFDVRNRISASYVYELPFGQGKAMLQSGPLRMDLRQLATSGVYTFYCGHRSRPPGETASSLLDAYGFATAAPNQVARHYLKKQTCWFYEAPTASAAQVRQPADDQPYRRPGQVRDWQRGPQHARRP